MLAGAVLQGGTRVMGIFSLLVAFPATRSI